MKLRLSILLLAAALAASPAAGQTIKSLGFNTTNGQVVYSGTNPLTFTNPLAFGDTTNTASIRTNLGLGATNYPVFRGLEITTDGDTLYINPWGINADTFGLVLNFEEQNFSQDGATVFQWATNSFTVTPNATLNGVNNTAPSQTADSASSLMTRELTDQRQIDRMIAGPRMVWLTTFTGWTTAVSGGSIGQNVFIRASSGTNQWNYAVARNFQLGELFSGSSDQLNFSKAGSFGTAYYSPGANYRDGTDVIYLGAAGTYVPSTGSAVSNPATKGFGWRIKDESIVATMYATNYVEVATDSAVLPSGATTRQNVWLYIDWDGTGAASWYVDGNEIASTTNGPTGLTSVNQAWLIFGSVADIPLTQQNANSISAFVLDREP
jgi:hypothetical protein